MSRVHDLGVILQFLLLIPAMVGVQKLSQQHSHSVSQASLATGIAALTFVIFFLLLIFSKFISEVHYMFPQGIFGVWLMVLNWRLSAILTRGHRWFGMVVGLGLALVGTFPLGYALFVDTIILQIPAASAEEVAKISGNSTANHILHQFLWIGSIMGVLTLPIWTILLGRRLLRERNTI